MELVSRMMDGSISYDPKARLEPVLSGAAVKEGDKIERLKEATKVKPDLKVLEGGKNKKK